MKHILSFLLILICSTNTMMSQTTITGIVSDDAGVLPDVNILINESQKGTVTDNEGYFEITAKKNDELSISHVGFETKYVTIDEQRGLAVILESNMALDEVVIVATKLKGCRLTTSCFSIGCNIECSVLGKDVKTNEEVYSPSGLKLYPNPSPRGVFTLNLHRRYGEVEVQVTDILGQMILIKSFRNGNKRLEIDLSPYPTGMYIVNTMVDGKRLPTKKAIVG